MFCKVVEQNKCYNFAEHHKMKNAGFNIFTFHKYHSFNIAIATTRDEKAIFLKLVKVFFVHVYQNKNF